MLFKAAAACRFRAFVDTGANNGGVGHGSMLLLSYIVAQIFWDVQRVKILPFMRRAR